VGFDIFKTDIFKTDIFKTDIFKTDMFKTDMFKTLSLPQILISRPPGCNPALAHLVNFPTLLLCLAGSMIGRTTD